jgi:hypothetical protein
MLVRDVLLALAGHDFFNPKWSAGIGAEWTRNLLERLSERSFGGDTLKRVERIAAAMDAAIDLEFPERRSSEPVQVKDRHVVAAAMAVQADEIVMFNIADFGASHLQEHLQIEALHPDDFVMDLIDLNEERAIAAFRELHARKQIPPLTPGELVQKLQRGGLVQNIMRPQFSRAVKCRGFAPCMLSCRRPIDCGGLVTCQWSPTNMNLRRGAP